MAASGATTRTSFYRETVGPPEDIGIGRIAAAGCRFVVHHIDEPLP